MSPLDRRAFLLRSTTATVGLFAPGLLTGCGTGADDPRDAGQEALAEAQPPDTPPQETGPVEDTTTPEAPGTVHALTSGSVSDLFDLGTRAAVALGLSGTALAGATVFLKPNFVTRERNAAGRYYVLAARDLVDADRAAARLMGFADDDVKALEG